MFTIAVVIVCTLVQQAKSIIKPPLIVWTIAVAFFGQKNLFQEAQIIVTIAVRLVAT